MSISQYNCHPAKKGQWNGIEIPKIDSYKYNQLIFYKEQRQLRRGKVVLNGTEKDLNFQIPPNIRLSTDLISIEENHQEDHQLTWKLEQATGFFPITPLCLEHVFHLPSPWQKLPRIESWYNNVVMRPSILAMWLKPIETSIEIFKI